MKTFNIMNVQNVSIGVLSLISVYLIWQLRETNKKVTMLEHDVKSIAEYLMAPNNPQQQNEMMNQQQQQRPQQRQVSRQSINERIVVPGANSDRGADHIPEPQQQQDEPRSMPRGGNKYTQQMSDQDDNIDMLFTQNNVMRK